MRILIEKNVEAKMRDGTVLRADVYRPAEDGRWPVLLVRTPYGKEILATAALTLDPIRAAGGGYVVVIQDVRARWASDGDEFFFYRDEAQDGYDTVAWASDMEHSDGTVGALGVSYMGGTTWLAATTGHPALRAIAPTQAPHDQFALLFRGGALLWGTLAMWSLVAIAPETIIRSKGGTPDFVPDLVRLVDDVDAFEDAVRHRPLREMPAARPEDASFLRFLDETLRHPVAGAFWEELSPAGRHGSVTAPALIVAGWHDLLLDADLAHFTAMRRTAGSAVARDRTRLVVGPWSHGAFGSVVGAVDYGFRASSMMIDLREDMTAMHLRWFDRHLKGFANGMDEEAPVKLFVQGANRWRDEDAWPPARAVPTDWYLASKGRLGLGVPAADDVPDHYRYDPDDPCPTLGGSTLLPRTYTPGPVDQTPLTKRGDVLVYESEPLEHDLEVTGHVSAVLWAASNARDTDWIVKLCDVHPDGRILNVCDGVLRASYRFGPGRRELLQPGEVARYTIDMSATSQVFKAGHRIAVLVASSDFPRYDRNPNTGSLAIDDPGGVTANQTVFHDAGRPSHVVLPVVR